jgi:hypothetical protein
LKGRQNEEKNNETEINEVVKLVVYYESINREITIRTDVCGIFDGYSRREDKKVHCLHRGSNSGPHNY